MILTVGWCGVANLGLIMPLFRQSVVTFYLHAICMWGVVVCTAVGVIGEIIVWDGRIVYGAIIHKYIGLVVFLFTFAIALLGVWTRITI